MSSDYYWPAQIGYDLAMCWCKCERHDARSVAADVWWLSPAGNWIGLCNACCAGWRANAVADPELQAVRITSERPL